MTIHVYESATSNGYGDNLGNGYGYGYGYSYAYSTGDGHGYGEGDGGVATGGAGGGNGDGNGNGDGVGDGYDSGNTKHGFNVDDEALGSLEVPDHLRSVFWPVTKQSFELAVAFVNAEADEQRDCVLGLAELVKEQAPHEKW